MCSAPSSTRPIWLPTALALALALLIAGLLAPARAAYAATASESFALLADTHLGQPYQTTYEEAEEALYWASEYDDLAAVCVAGDLTDRGDPEAYSEWEFLCDSILDEASRIQALGDHDTGKNGEYLKVDSSLTVANGSRCFKEINGGALTSFSEFRYANVMTIGAIRASGHAVITNKMLAQLNARLRKTARQGKMAIVICHYPYDSSVLNKRAKLMGILRSYPNVIYVSGHKHTYSSSAQCKLAKPSCTTTPYLRAGCNKATKYAIRSIGVNACSAYRSGNGNSYADMLTISQDGKVALQKWNLTKGRVDKKWAFKQLKSSVTVRNVPSGAGYSKKAKFTYKITFSDGKTHGGLKSGSTFALTAGKSKKLSGIPAGVLVSVKLVKAPSGWSKGSAKSIEVAGKAQKLAMKTRYKGKSVSTATASKLRAA